MTLVELLVAMSILGIVLLVFTSVLASVQRGVVRQDSLSQTLDSARLAVQQLDRELRSGNVLYDPALENAPVGTPGRIASCTGCLPGYTLRVYTQTNADTRGPTPVPVRPVEDRGPTAHDPVVAPLEPVQASGWRIVAKGIVNRDLSPATVAFVLDPIRSRAAERSTSCTRPMPISSTTRRRPRRCRRPSRAATRRTDIPATSANRHRPARRIRC
jgi:type II secretory pathway pseudopilin PulG